MYNNYSIFQSANKIIQSFHSIIDKDYKLDENLDNTKKSIIVVCNEKIKKAEVIFVNKVSIANDNYTMQLEVIKKLENDISSVEKSIPEFVKHRYKSSGARTAKKPDFPLMYGLVNRLKDQTFTGLLKRASNFDGYSSVSEMGIELLDSIAASYAYIEEEKKKSLCSLQCAKQQYNTDLLSEKSKFISQKDNDIFAAENKYKLASHTLEMEFSQLLTSPELLNFDKNIINLLINLNAFDEKWDDYTIQKEESNPFLLGAIELPLNLPSTIREVVKQIMPYSYDGNSSITIPLLFSPLIPFILQIEYSENKKSNHIQGLQDFLLKLFKNLSSHSFHITYIDPISRGTDLGDLLRLSEVNSFNLCEICAAKEDILKQMRYLEKFVDETSISLASHKDINEYNSYQKKQIPRHFVVINSFPASFDNATTEILKTLLNNASKCGISFIFLTKEKCNLFNPDIIINSKISKVSFMNKQYDFKFDDIISNSEEYITSIIKVYEDGIKVDNGFGSFFDLDKEFQFSDSTHSIKIPFAVDSNNEIVSLSIAGPQTAHALLSGRSGSGKSTTLHMIISSLIMNYHPDDVELWLVDYKKVEFAEYIDKNIPHIKFIGLERNSEFTFSLLKKLDSEFKNRMEIFANPDVDVNSITEYKQKFGTHSMPRIVIIIDEFHNLTQNILKESVYVEIFENMISEYRSLGLTCIFSDQAITDGLKGLTDKGKKQLSVRLAMENDPSEIKETLAMDNSTYSDLIKEKSSVMLAGDIIFKQIINGAVLIDKYKSINIDREQRNILSQKIKKQLQGHYKLKEVLIVDGKDQKYYDEQVIMKYENDFNVDKNKTIPIYIGTPVSLEPCFKLSLRNKVDSNIMSVGADDELNASILLHSIYSFKRNKNVVVKIFAHPDNEIFFKYKNMLSEILGAEDGIYYEISEICNQVKDLSDNLNNQKKKALLCWLGLDDLNDVFSEFGPRIESSKCKTTVANKTKYDDINNMLKEIDILLDEFDDEIDSEDIQSSDELYNFDARSEIQEIFLKGPKNNVFSYVTLSSVKSIRPCKFIRTENFEHKIALNMSFDDSATYLGRGAHASSLDSISAVYDDGSNKVQKFHPYLID